MSGTQAIQRESNKLGLAKILDLVFVPSSFVRFVAKINKKGGMPPFLVPASPIETIAKVPKNEMPSVDTLQKVIGYTWATSAELARLFIYYSLPELLHKVVNTN